MKRRSVVSAISTPMIAFSGCISGDYSFGNNQPGSHDDATSEWGDNSTDGPLISENFTCSAANRPTPGVSEGIEHTVESDGETTVVDSVGSREYPAAPSNLNDSTIRQFLKEHEVAYQQNSFVALRRDRVVEFEVWIEEIEFFNNYSESKTVRLDFSIHYEVVKDGKLQRTEPSYGATVYGIDQTGLIRQETEHREYIDGSVENHTPDPFSNGAVVVCFSK